MSLPGRALVAVGRDDDGAGHVVLLIECCGPGDR